MPLFVRSVDRALVRDPFSSAEFCEDEDVCRVTSVPAMPRIKPVMKIRMLVFMAGNLLCSEFLMNSR